MDHTRIVLSLDELDKIYNGEIVSKTVYVPVDGAFITEVVIDLGYVN